MIRQGSINLGITSLYKLALLLAMCPMQLQQRHRPLHNATSATHARSQGIEELRAPCLSMVVDMAEEVSDSLILLPTLHSTVAVARDHQTCPLTSGLWLPMNGLDTRPLKM